MSLVLGSLNTFSLISLGEKDTIVLERSTGGLETTGGVGVGSFRMPHSLESRVQATDKAAAVSTPNRYIFFIVFTFLEFNFGVIIYSREFYFTINSVDIPFFR